MLEDKLYTIAEIAKITHLTDRTIRNYLAKGNLKGCKVGGQWRFNKQNVKDLFKDAEFGNDMKDKTEKKINSFYQNNKDLNKACITLNFQIKEKEARHTFFEKVNQLKEDKIQDTISFIEEDGKIKMIIIGSISYINKVLCLLTEEQS